MFLRLKSNLLLFLILFFYAVASGANSCWDYLHPYKVENSNYEPVVSHPITLKIDGILKFNKGSYSNPLNKMQRDFLIRLGAKFYSKKVVLPSVYIMATRYNKIVDDMILEGTILAKDAVYWGDVLVQNQKLIAIKYGSPRPLGSKPFIARNYKFINGLYIEHSESLISADPSNRIKKATSFLESSVFEAMVAQGLLPVAQDIREFFQFYTDYDYSAFEQALLHDIAHLGGFIDEPKMMVLFKNWATLGKRPENSHLASYFINLNENLVLTNPELSRSLQDDFFDPARLPRWADNSILDMPNFELDKSLESYLDSLTIVELMTLTDTVLDLYPTYRFPIGGTVRTAAFAVRRNIQSMVDFNYINLQRKNRSLENKMNPSVGTKLYGKLSKLFTNTPTTEPDFRQIKHILREFLVSYNKIVGLNFEDYIRKFHPSFYEALK